MVIMGRKLMWGVILFSLFLNCAAFGTTLEEAVIFALETNPSIGATESDVRASEIDIDTARAAYFPSLDIVQSTVGYQHVRIRNKATPISLPFIGEATQRVTNPTVILSQTVFDGLAAIFAVEHARSQAQAAYSILGQTREQTALNAVSAYITLLAQQQLLELANENIQKHQDILEKVKKRVTGGISTIADVYQVESRLEDAFVVRDRTVGQLGNAVANFISVVGFRPDHLEPVLLPAEPISCGIQAILERVSQNNPGVVVEKNHLLVAEAALDQTVSPFMPTVQLQLLSNAPVINIGGSTGRQYTYTAQAVVNYNLFRGGGDLSKRKAQMERVVGAKIRIDVARRNAIKISQSALATYQSAVAQAQDSSQAIEMNMKLERAYELQFELVSRPLLDLLDAYVSYYRSKNDNITARADEDINHAILLASMGDLECSFRRLQSVPCSESCLPREVEGIEDYTSSGENKTTHPPVS
jgi:outer membrane protein, adhesin transport system